MRTSLFVLFITLLSSVASAQDGMDARERATRRFEAAQTAAATRAACDPMATARPPAGGWTGWEPEDVNVSGFTCGIGGAGYCAPLGDNAGRGDAMLDRLEEECPTTTHHTPLRDLNFAMVGPYADTTYFQELANRTVTETHCQLQILDPQQRQPLVQSAWQLFSEVQPLMNVLVQQRQVLQAELRELGLALADPRANSGARAMQTRLNEQIAGINNAIAGLIAELPFGSQDIVKNSLMEYAGRNISAGQFANLYNGALTEVRSQFEDASCTYQAIRNPRSGVFRLDQSQKIALYNSPGAQELLRRIDPDGNRLTCQLRRCYVTGPRNVQFVAIAALLGVTILSAGTASPFVGAVATVGAIGFSAAQIERACGRSTITATAQQSRQCTASAMAQLTVDRVTFAGCATEVALGSLDLLPGVAGARRLLQARRLARTSGAAVDTAQATARTDGLLSGTLRLGQEGDEVAEQAIRVVGSSTPQQRAIRVAGRLERGEDPSALLESFGYSRVLGGSSDTRVFRNARGEQIVLPGSGRLASGEADRVADVLRRGRGSYTAPGVSTTADASARTLSAALGSPERARIISAVDVNNTETLDDAIADLFQLTARAEPAPAFASLTPAQRVRALADLEAGLRVRNPSLLESAAFRAYKQRLQRDLTLYSARIVGDSEDLAIRLQDELGGISPAGRAADDFRLVASGRADEVIARTPGITVDQANRLRQYQDRIAEARRAIDEIPGARIPDSIRIADELPSPGRTVARAEETTGGVTRADAARGNRTQLSREDLRALEDAGLRDLLNRSLNRRIASGPAQDLERRILLEDLQATFSRWGNKREEVFRFLNNSAPALSRAEKERFFAILVNTEDDVSVVIARLQRIRAGGTARAQEFRLMDDRILELSRRIQEGVANGTDVRLIAEQRSALVLERNLLELGDDLEIQRIFPARAHNDASQAAQNGAEQGRHSLDGSFSLDVRARRGSDISVCRGSYITPGAVASGMVSGLAGSFYTFCRSDGYLDRPVLGAVVAAPVDGTINESLRGYTRFNRFQLRPDMDISLGRNGPVEYLDARNADNVTNGTGGPGGGIEFFVSRNGQRLDLDDLRASVRTPSCVRSSANPICDRIFRIQESLRPGTLRQGVGPEAIYAANGHIDDLLRDLAPQIDRYMESVRTAPDSATLQRLREEYPEVVSALNLRRELELKMQIGFVPRAGRTGDIDADTRDLINLERSAASYAPPGRGSEAGDIFQRIRTSGGGNPQATSEAFIREINQSNVVQAYRQSQEELARLTRQLNTSTNLTPMARADLLYNMNTLAARMDDMRLAANGIAYRMRSAVTSDALGLTPELQQRVLAHIRETLPHTN